MYQRILASWCRNFHGTPMHPIDGLYRCRRCLRTFPVEWEGSPTKPKTIKPSGRRINDIPARQSVTVSKQSETITQFEQ